MLAGSEHLLIPPRQARSSDRVEELAQNNQSPFANLLCYYDRTSSDLGGKQCKLLHFASVQTLSFHQAVLPSKLPLLIVRYHLALQKHHLTHGRMYQTISEIHQTLESIAL